MRRYYVWPMICSCSVTVSHTKSTPVTTWYVWGISCHKTCSLQRRLIQVLEPELQQDGVVLILGLESIQNLLPESGHGH